MLTITDPGLSTLVSPDLIKAARAGSSEARGRVIQACWDDMITVARREMAADLQPRAGASDLVQETFLYANQAFSRFQGRDHRQLQAWIRKILLYRISHFRRGQRALTRSPKREVRIDDSRAALPLLPDSSEHSCCTQLIREEQLTRLRCAIKALKPKHREMIVMRGLEQRSFEEIAQRQGRTIDAVRRAWVRAAGRLCEEYNRLDGSTGSIAGIL